jgi:hypothetical protein
VRWEWLRGWFGEVGGAVNERRIEEVIEELGAQLEAAIERDERVAAKDLAISLLQDLHLADVLVRAGHEAELPDGSWLPVTFAAEDHIETGGSRGRVLVPLDVCVLRPARSAPAAARGVPLVEILRALARDRAKVRVHLGRGFLEGTLTRAGRDHVIVQHGERIWIFHLQRLKALEVIAPEG